MTRDKAELMKRAVLEDEADPAYKVSRVEVQEPLPDDFVVAVYLEGYAEPCVMGEGPVVQAWLDAHNKVAVEGDITMSQADHVARKLLGGDLP